MRAALPRTFSRVADIELVEHTPAQEEVYTRIWRASLDWDGSDPIRKEG